MVFFFFGFFCECYYDYSSVNVFTSHDEIFQYDDCVGIIFWQFGKVSGYTLEKYNLLFFSVSLSFCPNFPLSKLTWGL